MSYQACKIWFVLVHRWHTSIHVGQVAILPLAIARQYHLYWIAQPKGQFQSDTQRCVQP